MAVTTLRSAALEAAQELCLQLKQYLVEQGVTAKEMSVAIGRAPEYLSRAFRGRFPLKIRDVFAVFHALGKSPRRFLMRYYPLGGADLEGSTRPEALSGLAGGALLSRLLETHLFEDAPLPPELVLQRAGRNLRGTIARSPTSQRAIAAELGMTEHAFGQALRNRSGLDAWHVFAVLRATGKSPARFFEEITEPEDAASLGPAAWQRILDLAEKAQRAGGKASAAKRRAGKTKKPRGK